MLNSKVLDDLGNRVKEILDKSPAKDVEKNLKAMLASAVSRLDLVTREEFEVQTQVLLRTREKLTDLEARLAAMGLLYLDAPLSGGAAKAASGEMTMMTSGCAEAYAICQPLLDAMAARVYKLGDTAGAGSANCSSIHAA